MGPNISSQLLEKVRTYKVPQKAVDLLTEHPPLIVAGVTASGKDAVEQHIEKISDWRHVVTHTTRPMREGEVNGKDYWFVSEDQMLDLINNEAFIEVKLIHKVQVSGPSLQAYSTILDSGFHPMLRIDVQGIHELRLKVPGVRPYFILPPSYEARMERLSGRGHMSHVEQTHRMHSAKEELQYALKDDHFIMVVNEDIAHTAQQIVDGGTDPSLQHHNRELAQQLLEHLQII